LKWNNDMRLPPVLLLSAIALTAGACATRAPAPTLTVLGSAPAPVAGYDWYLHLDGDDARLAYGQEDSDDLRLGLDCRRGTGRLALSATGETGAAPEIQLESGGETALYPASAEASELTDGVLLSAPAPATAPVFRNFRALGWLTHWQDGGRHPYAAQPGSGERIARFFVFCG
jgi:hypothetical protein